MSNQRVTSDEVVTQKLVLNDMAVSSIITGNDTLSMDPMGLITQGALDLALQEINHYMKVVDPDGVQLDDLALITRSIVDPYFDKATDWHVKNWYVQHNMLRCSKSDNNFSVNIDRFKKRGRYLMCLNIESMPSGKLEISKNGQWLYSMFSAGVYYKEIDIDDLLNDQITFAWVGGETDDVVSIFSLSIHHIADRLYSYILTKIRELATVSAEDYMNREEISHTLDDFVVQFQDATKRYMRALTEHKTADNPHGLTAASVGAAPTNHMHAQYLTKNELKAAVSEQMGDYAKKDHYHPGYLTADDAKLLIMASIQEHIKSMVSVAPLIITKGPLGILPSRFAQTEISIPTTILIPTTVDHNCSTSFDVSYGFITTNDESLMKESYKIFALDPEVFATLAPIAHPVNFRIMYHTYRHVSGYRIRCKRGFPTEWMIFVGDTTYIHRLTAKKEDFEEQENGELIKDIYFENIEEAPMFTILMLSAEVEGSDWDFKVEILYEDFEDDFSLGITNEAFQFSIPSSGVNRLINMPAKLDRTVLSPEVCHENTPIYIFGGKDAVDPNPYFDYSYIPPEYGLVRRGLNVLLDKFQDIPREADGQETYQHPAFGTLKLEEGYTKEGTSLLCIYDSTTNGWMSDGQTTRVTISQTFDSPNVVLTGYMLNWRKTDEQFIPDTWTLTVEGVTADGKEVTVVMDSVEQYFPFYSVEDDDIVYHKHFEREMTVKKVTLTMAVKDDADIPYMAINKLYFYLSEHFYSIPQNTMYRGIQETAEICLGSATYKKNVGWNVVNAPIGKSCVICVNNLKPTERFTIYTVPNPFHTTDVSVDIQNYLLQDLRPGEEGPSAYVTKITADYIEMMSENSFRYALAINRKW